MSLLRSTYVVHLPVADSGCKLMKGLGAYRLVRWSDERWKYYRGKARVRLR